MKTVRPSLRRSRCSRPVLSIECPPVAPVPLACARDKARQTAELRRTFERLRDAQDALLVEGAADDLQPSGSPSTDNPAGTEIAGKPARFAGTVNTSFRYIAIGSSLLSPIAKAAEGAVGAKMQSTRAKAAAKSCAISVRTR